MTAADISWTDDLQTTICNTAVHITGGALINFDASGDLNTSSVRDTVFRIYNNGGGSIGSDAMINVSAANVSLGGPLPVEILNQGGSIGGSASVDLTATNFSASSLQADIDNTGGSVGGEATITLSVASLSVGGGGATVFANNSNGGMISGNATITS